MPTIVAKPPVNCEPVPKWATLNYVGDIPKQSPGACVLPGVGNNGENRRDFGRTRKSHRPAADVAKRME
jgi:hypothetical protein